MARKTCPICKQLTGASSETCSRCGHVYAAQSVALVEARPVKRCLMCGLTNLATAERCECGADLEIDPADLRSWSAHRRSTGWAMLVGSIALGLGSILGGALLVFAFGLVGSPKGTLLALLAMFTGVGMATAGCRKATRILGATRLARDELEGKTDALPSARIHQ